MEYLLSQSRSAMSLLCPVPPPPSPPLAGVRAQTQALFHLGPALRQVNTTTAEPSESLSLGKEIPSKFLKWSRRLKTEIVLEFIF